MGGLQSTSRVEDGFEAVSQPEVARIHDEKLPIEAMLFAEIPIACGSRLGPVGDETDIVLPYPALQEAVRHAATERNDFMLATQREGRKRAADFCNASVSGKHTEFFSQF